jgi:Putative F0F1-ATPase subunit Ca2+/Mg2+ transporter
MPSSSLRSVSHSWSRPSSASSRVDEKLGTLPIFLLVGFLIGAGSGTVMIYRLVSRFLKTIK